MPLSPTPAERVDYSTFRSPVLLLKPYHEIPRFSLGFIPEGSITSGAAKVYLPLLQNVIDIPFNYLRPYKHDTITNLVSVPIKTFTIDHLRNIDKAVFSIKAENRYNTISKSRLQDLLNVLFSCFPSISASQNQKNSLQGRPAAITKINITSLKTILPMLMKHMEGIFITVMLRHLDDFTHVDQLLFFGVNDSARGVTFDGGPLPILLQKVQVLDSSSARSFFKNLPIYTITGDILCVE